MKTGRGAGPLFKQRVAVFFKLWPLLVGAFEIGKAKRVQLGGYKMQPRIGRRMLNKALDSQQRVQPGAKAGFTDDKQPVGRQRGKALDRKSVVKGKMGREREAGNIATR